MSQNIRIVNLKNTKQLGSGQGISVPKRQTLNVGSSFYNKDLGIEGTIIKIIDNDTFEVDYGRAGIIRQKKEQIGIKEEYETKIKKEDKRIAKCLRICKIPTIQGTQTASKKCQPKGIGKTAKKNKTFCKKQCNIEECDGGKDKVERIINIMKQEDEQKEREQQNILASALKKPIVPPRKQHDSKRIELCKQCGTEKRAETTKFCKECLNDRVITQKIVDANKRKEQIKKEQAEEQRRKAEEQREQEQRRIEEQEKENRERSKLDEMKRIQKEIEYCEKCIGRTDVIKNNKCLECINVKIVKLSEKEKQFVCDKLFADKTGWDKKSSKSTDKETREQRRKLCRNTCEGTYLEDQPGTDYEICVDPKQIETARPFKGQLKEIARLNLEKTKSAEQAKINKGKLSDAKVEKSKEKIKTVEQALKQIQKAGPKKISQIVTQPVRKQVKILNTKPVAKKPVTAPVTAPVTVPVTAPVTTKKPVTSPVTAPVTKSVPKQIKGLLNLIKLNTTKNVSKKSRKTKENDTKIRIEKVNNLNKSVNNYRKILGEKNLNINTQDGDKISELSDEIMKTTRKISQITNDLEQFNNIPSNMIRDKRIINLEEVSKTVKDYNRIY